MLTIETNGSWRQMGAEIGETFRDETLRCLDRFLKWARNNPARAAEAAALVKKKVERHAPELAEETTGFAEGADMDETTAWQYRFMNDVRLSMKRDPEGCCAIRIEDEAKGPLLGRNCDLEPDISQDIQLLRISRPDKGMATISFSYLGMVSGAGLNERGFGMGGASAHTPPLPDENGTSSALLQFHLLNHCQTVNEAASFLIDKFFSGKPCNVMTADRSGASMIVEFAPGRQPVTIQRAPESTWQAFTNFFTSGQIPIKPEREYLENAYARYGRIVHQLDGASPPQSVSGLKTLLTDVAKPSLCNTGRNGESLTAYSFILELANGTVHYVPGHPAKNAWKTVTL